MKKTFVAAIISAALLMLAGCSSAKADKFGWYSDFEEAKKIAQKQDKNILLFVSILDADENSATLSSNVLRTDEFKSYASKSLVCVNMDFSQTEYEEAMVDDTATDAQKKKAEEIQKKYEKNMRIVSSYYVEETPALFLATKDGYVISTIAYDTSIIAPKDFIALLDEQAEKSTEINNLVAATTKGSKIEQAKAIDNLYEATAPESRMLLEDQISRFLTLDTNNETGLCGKYLIASANIEAQNAFMIGDASAAVAAFDKVTNSELSSPDEKQQAYYMSAYALIQTGSQDMALVLDMFQKAFDANPESEYAPQIQQSVLLLQQMMMAQQMEQFGPEAQPQTAE